MKKELIICFTIICAIIIGDIWLQNYTKDSLTTISNQLDEMKGNLESEEYAKEQIKKINEEWDKRFNILTCFLEHDELEKVKTELVAVEAGVEINDMDYVYEEINKAIYILEHIEDKQSFKIDNIF